MVHQGARQKGQRRAAKEKQGPGDGSCAAHGLPQPARRGPHLARRVSQAYASQAGDGGSHQGRQQRPEEGARQGAIAQSQHHVEGGIGARRETAVGAHQQVGVQDPGAEGHDSRQDHFAGQAAQEGAQ